MAIARSCCLISVIIFLLVSNSGAGTRRRRGHARLPMPTKETLPYVAEVLGATSFEEVTDDTAVSSTKTSSRTSSRNNVQEPVEEESKRVQRKLPPDSETTKLDNVPYMEYQGVMGRPGVDFPVLATIPRTDFSCRSVKQAGYYADLHTGCQVFHICDGGRKISFLCPNGTIFRQSHLICDWWFRVDCGKSKEQYEESAELLAHDQMVYKKRAEEIAKAMQQGESKSHEERLQLVELPTPTTIRPKNQQRRKSTRVTASTLVNNPNEFDRERQVPAESSSFIGNQRHRFSSNLGDSISRNAFSGETSKYSTTSSPSFSVQQSTTAKPVFTIRVKPNREFSFVELQKHDSKKLPKGDESVSFQPNPYPNVQFVTSSPVQVSTQYSYTHTPSPTRIQYSSAKTSKYNALSMNTKYSSGYSKNKINYSVATTQLPPFFSSNKTNDIEFIRPEIINSLMEMETTTSYPKFGTPTPASAVNTLHSLASYYESAANDVQKELNKDIETYTKPPVSEILLRAHSTSGGTATGELEEKITTMLTTPSAAPTLSYNDTVLPSVLTKATQVSYSYLFKNEQRPNESVSEFVTPKIAFTGSKDIDVNINKKIPERLVVDNTIGIGEKDTSKNDDSKEIQQQRESADLRELAQVFTRALSAYLEDPESFKEILAQVRPTEPSLADVTTPSPEDEVLAFSDDNKNLNTKPHALPFRAGTTARPITPNDINNFIAAVTNIEADNSLEVSSSGVAAKPLGLNPVRYFTTSVPTSIAHDINGIAINSSLNNLASGEYYTSALGSSEDNSYFPTAGGVTDGTRPRYGGFQNNSGDVYVNNRKYSRYGSELPPNITGAPLSERSTTFNPTTTPYSISTLKSTEEKMYQKIPEKLNLPDAYDVNNLATNNFFSDTSSKFSSEEAAYPNHKIEDPLLRSENDFFNNGADQEKLLIASGTQSLFSANNYFKYDGKTPEVQKDVNNDHPSLYSPFSYTNNEANQIPIGSPLIINHNIQPESEETTFPTTTFLGDYLNQEQTTFSPQFEDFINNGGESFSTIDPSLEQITTFNYNPDNPTEAQYKIQNVNLGNGVTLERTLKYNKPSAVTWSVPTPTEIVSDDWSEENQDVPPTTYHPLHKNEPAVTTPNPFFIPPEPQLEQKAKEMFGGLNETATGKLMNMVDKAESNTTIRKLVLLLVNDNKKENITVEESRANLIQALLVNDGSDSSSESLDNSKEGSSLSNDYDKLTGTRCGQENGNGMEHMAHSDRYNMKPCGSSDEPVATTQLPIETSSRMEFSISSSSGTADGEKLSSKYRSGKNYRATDSQTAVLGSTLHTTELNNRINSAKLYIPSSPEKKIPYSSDARAVELLKSLYNLAAKFG